MNHEQRVVEFLGGAPTPADRRRILLRIDSAVLGDEQGAEVFSRW
jgi:hypothetical protein